MSFPPPPSSNSARLTHSNLIRLDDDVSRKQQKNQNGSEWSTSSHYGPVQMTLERDYEARQREPSTVASSAPVCGSYYPTFQQGRGVPDNTPSKRIVMNPNRNLVDANSNARNSFNNAPSIRAASSSFHRMKEWLVDNAVDVPKYPAEYYDHGYDVSLSDDEGEADDPSATSGTPAKIRSTDEGPATSGSITVKSETRDAQRISATMPTASSTWRR